MKPLYNSFLFILCFCFIVIFSVGIGFNEGTAADKIIVCKNNYSQKNCFDGSKGLISPFMGR